MKAVYITGYGRPADVLKYGESPVPAMGPKQILVEVKAVSINPVDYKTFSGITRLISRFRFPKIVGSDFAGIIRETGADVQDFKPGDRVYGSSPVIFNKPGMLAELAAIDTKYARKIPDLMSYEDAASMPIAGLTALNGLRKGRLSAGKAVLVNGATGGVGHFALQIARAQGAIVTATCSDGNRETARALGASEVTGYSRKEMESLTGKFDIILDAYGMMNLGSIIRLLKKGGVYASTLFFPPRSFFALDIRILFNRKLTSANMRSLPEDYSRLEELYLDGKLKPLIDKKFPLEKAAEAFIFAEKGKPKGKVIITL